MIGYGFKGGRTLLVRVGVMETRAGEDAARSLSYAGLFSPRKAGYDLQLAALDKAAQSDAASTLLSEPATQGRSSGLRVLHGDQQQLDEFAVDMWAMRVVKAEGINRLGRGITAQLSQKGTAWSGTVTNNSPYPLVDCHIVYGSEVLRPGKGTLEPGQSVTFETKGRGPLAGAAILPAAILSDVQGSREEQRMKRSVLQTLCSTGSGGPYTWTLPDYPLLVGWVRETEPVVRLQVDGKRPREMASTLMLVHLADPQPR
jgi:hypothetical protein